MTDQYAPRKHLIGNIHPVDLIVSEIHFARRQREFAFEDYNKAVLNHDNGGLQLAHDQMQVQIGVILGLTKALRYVLAAEAEQRGRRVSESMVEIDEKIERLLEENPLD